MFLVASVQAIAFPTKLRMLFMILLASTKVKEVEEKAVNILIIRALEDTRATGECLRALPIKMQPRATSKAA